LRKNHVAVLLATRALQNELWARTKYNQLKKCRVGIWAAHGDIQTKGKFRQWSLSSDQVAQKN